MQDLKSPNKKHTEREIRISSDLTHSIGALKIIDKLGKCSKIESSMIHQYPNNIRTVTDLVTGAYSIENKRVSEKIVKGRGYKVVTSTEEPTKLDINANYIFIAYRLRFIYNDWIYKHNNGSTYKGDLHITFRTEISNTISSFVSIEVEIPYYTINNHNDPYKDNIIDGMVNNILTIHNGYIISNIADRILTIKSNYITTMLNGRIVVPKPIDLKWNQLKEVYMINNPHAISFKADGTRMYLLTCPNGTYFITTNMNIIPINDIAYKTTNLLDGELMDNTYYAFDIIKHDNDDSRDYDYISRHKLVTQVVNTIRTITPLFKLPLIPTDKVLTSKTIELVAKDIIIPKTVDEFFQATKSMINMKNNIATDGIIITPVNESYMIEPGNEKLNILKWKPISQLTVDFFVNSIDKISIFNNKSIVDISTLKYNDISIKYKATGIDNSHIGTVAEFHYLGKDNITGEQQWKYYRSRYDKAIPNSSRVYMDILRIHDDPITEEAITGNSLRLMRKYHNQEKRNIYSLLSILDVKILTDIGSGKGGDLSKWIQHNMHVQAIEPDMDNIRELLSRITNVGGIILDIDDKEYISHINSTEIDIYNAYVEDIIYKGLVDIDEADAVTLFNSATFLGPTTLVNLAIGYVRNGGRLVIMVIDGNKLIETFLHSSNSYHSDLIDIQRIDDNPSIDSSNLNTVVSVGSELFGTLGRISISLKDSATVQRTQIEGLVDVSVLIQVLTNEGFTLEYDVFLDKENLLGIDEKLYTSTQRLLIFRNDGFELTKPDIDLISIDGMQAIPNCPYGFCYHIGTMYDKDKSFYESILLIYSKEYRSLSIKDRESTFESIQTNVMNELKQKNIPIYAILDKSWDIFHYEYNSSTRYPYYSKEYRNPGIVLLFTNDKWEPLIINKNGSYKFIW